MINTDSKLIFADTTYNIRKAIFTVYNTLGYGHKEEVYQKALAKELTLLNVPYEKEVPLKVSYKDDIVGHYRPDFVVIKKIVLELKATEYMPKSYETQLLHYLKTTGFSLGLLVNFGTPKVYIKRLVWTNTKSV